ncbi:MAG: glycosyltransferase [Actinomycetota bacterium]
MSRPRATVALPTVDRIGYLKESLESAAAQRYPNLEVLVSDNSADARYARQVDALVAAAREKFPDVDIRVEHQADQITMEENINFLVDHAMGEFWVYLPDDDRLLPECVTTLAASLERFPEASLAFSNHWIIDGAGRRMPRETEGHINGTHRGGLQEGIITHPLLKKLALWSAVPLPGTLYRTTLLRRFPSRTTAAPDIDLVLRLADAEQEIQASFTPALLAEYRRHPGNYSVWTPTLWRSMVRDLERCQRLPAAEPRLYRRTLSKNYASLGKTLLTEDRASARRALRTALRLSPANPLCYRFLLQSLIPERIGQRLRNSRTPSRRGT